MKGWVIILLVVAALVGGIFTLLSTRNSGMPKQDVIERTKKREHDQSAKDDADNADK